MADEDDRVKKILDEHTREYYDSQLKITALIVLLFLTALWLITR
jgi:hypothetical protein